MDEFPKKPQIPRSKFELLKPQLTNQDFSKKKLKTVVMQSVDKQHKFGLFNSLGHSFRLGLKKRTITCMTSFVNGPFEGGGGFPHPDRVKQKCEVGQGMTSLIPNSCNVKHRVECRNIQMITCP